MSVQRKSEITVGTAVGEWSEEMVGQWNALADTITRTVQQRSGAVDGKSDQERLAQTREIEQARATVVESEARIAAVKREATARLETMRRDYELKLTALRQELEQRDQQHGIAGVAEAEEEVAQSEEEVWDEEPVPSRWQTGREALQERGARLRSQPYFMPAFGFLAGLLLMAGVYSLLHRSSGASTALNSKPVSTATTARSGRGLDSAISPVEAASLKSSFGAATSSETEAAALPTKTTVVADAGSKYAVLLAGGKTLTAGAPGSPSAAYEAHLAMHAGYAATALYQRDGRYMAAVLFSSKEEAQEGLKTINEPYAGRWKKTSSVVALDDWCPVKQAADRVVINGAEVTVWSCSKNPG